MPITQPQAGEYSDFNYEYIRRVPQGDVLDFMETQFAQGMQLLRALSEEQGMIRPAPGEWSIKQVIGHMSDTERIFAYRALRIARGDTTPLPGFDQDPYVPAGHFEERTLSDLLDEFVAIRHANLFLFRNLTTEDAMRMGTASNNPISVRSLVYMCAGHEHHHMESLRTVYLGMNQ